MESVRLEMRADWTEVVLQGALSIAQTREVQQQLTKALALGRPIVVDADKLERLDGAVAQLLLAFSLAARERGLGPDWYRVSPELARVAALLGLTETLNVSEPSRAAAA